MELTSINEWGERTSMELTSLDRAVIAQALHRTANEFRRVARNRQNAGMANAGLRSRLRHNAAYNVRLADKIFPELNKEVK
jgi:hypothetical protein